MLVDTHCHIFKEYYQDIDEVIARLEGTTCGGKTTSCPDQLAQALKEAKASL